MKKVVVVGANGYIGAHATAELLRHPDAFAVVAADLSAQNLPAGVDFVSIDINRDAERPDLYEMLREPDICLYFAWRNGFEHNAMSHIQDFPNHFMFMKNLADHGVRHFAVTGSFREYGSVNGMADEHAPVTPGNYYMLSKSMLKSVLEICFKDRDICLQWLRPFTVYGDDERNRSIFSRIIQWEKEGKATFPFTDGSEQYDYISVSELGRQVAAIIDQTEISGVIDCCSGRPERLGDRVEAFLAERGFRIRPEYGAFPRRGYDSPVIYGNAEKIRTIMQKSRFFGGETHE